MLYVRHLLFYWLLLFVASDIYSQSFDTLDTYRHVLSIEHSSRSDNQKLQALYKIKTAAEKQGLVADSGYFLCLIKTAKYEASVKQNHQAAIQYSTEALRLNQRLTNKINKPLLVNAYFNLATYYQQLPKESNALACYDTTIFLCGQKDPDDYIILSRYQRTLIYFLLTDFQRVVEESTLGLEEAQRRDDAYYKACFYNFRAIAAMYNNQLSKATEDIEAALAIGRTADDADAKYELANSYKTKAQILDKQKEYKEAEFYFTQAILVRPHLPRFLDAVAVDFNDLGIFYMNSLHDLAKTKINFNHTLNYAKQCKPDNQKTLLTMVYGNLGEACMKEGNLSLAKNYYQLACNAINLNVPDFLSSDIPMKLLSTIRYRDLMYELLIGKTELLFQYFKKTKQTSYLEACLKTAILTDTFITQTRHESLGERSKLYWRNETRDFFSTAIEASYYLHDIKTAFYFMERSRSVLLTDTWNELKAEALLSPEENAQEESLRIKIIEQQRAVSLLAPASDAYKTAETKLVRVRTDFENYIRWLEKKHPQYYLSRYADDVLSLSNVQNYLQENKQSFIYYYVNDSAVYALVISGTSNKFIRIPAKDFDSYQLSRFTEICRNKQELNRNYPEFLSLSQTIYNKLFKPLQVPKGKIAICNDNFFIPFEALCTDNEGKHLLLEDYSFSYVYSARSLINPYTGTKASGNFAGFAPVAFSSSLNVFPLLRSATALQNVEKYYDNSTLFTQTNATRRNFFINADKYAVVTIFSHAQADTTDTEPVLYMQDSLIHLSELQMLHNPAMQFVLLSACQTNIGKNATGEGIYSLARGFAASGVPSVSATLWKADEEAIYEISAKFNEHLAGGMDKSEALRMAKLWYLQHSSREHALPYYWANLVLIGSSQPIELIKTDHKRMWVMVIASTLIFGFLVWMYKRKRRPAF